MSETRGGNELRAGVPFGEYRKIRALNHSTMEAGLLSMAHVRERLAGSDDGETAATVLGRAVHTLALEPETFGAEYLVGGPINPRTGSTFGRDTKAFAEWAAEHPGKTILSPEQHVAAQRMAESLRRHPIAGGLLAKATARECVALWTDPRSGLACKARLDAFAAGIVAADVKTAECAEPARFLRAAIRYGYHRQCEWYMRGFAAATGGVVTPYILAVVENAAPWCVAIYRPTPEALQMAMIENDRLLERIAACDRAKSWPGYDESIIDLALPGWYLSPMVAAPPDDATDDDYPF